MENIQLRKRAPKSETLTESQERFCDEMYEESMTRSRKSQLSTNLKRNWTSPLLQYKNIFATEWKAEFSGLHSDCSADALSIKSFHARQADPYFRMCLSNVVGYSLDTDQAIRAFVDIWEARIAALISSHQNVIDSDKKRGGTFAIQILLASVVENNNCEIHSDEIEEIVHFIDLQIGLKSVAHLICLQGNADASVQLDIGVSGIYLFMIWGMDIAEKFINWTNNDDYYQIIQPGKIPRIPLIRSSLGIGPLIKTLHKFKSQAGEIPRTRLRGVHSDTAVSMRWMMNVHENASESSNLTIQIIISSLVAEQFKYFMSKSLIELFQLRQPVSRFDKINQDSKISSVATNNPNIAALTGQDTDSLKDSHGMGFDQLLKFKELVTGDLREQYLETEARFGMDVDPESTMFYTEDWAKILLQLLNANFDPVYCASFFKRKGFWRSLFFTGDEYICYLRLLDNGDSLYYYATDGLPEFPVQHCEDAEDFDDYYHRRGDKDCINLHDCTHLLQSCFKPSNTEDLPRFPLLAVFLSEIEMPHSFCALRVDPPHKRLYCTFEKIVNLRAQRNQMFVRMRNFINRKFDDALKSKELSEKSEYIKFAKFLSRVFNPDDPKGFILVQSGGTNSGKSFQAHAISNLFHRMNGIVIGSQLDAGFVRVSHLGVRMLRIVEEFKGNLIETFHHLEANGTQLRKNNAVIDSRINLTIINCDKKNYSVDSEKELLLGFRNNYSDEVIKNIESRAAQVEARVYIALLEDQESMWGHMSDFSRAMSIFQKQINAHMWDMGVRCWNFEKPLNLQAYHLWNRAEVVDGNVSFFSGDTFFASYATLNYLLYKALTHKFPVEIMDPIQMNMTRILARELDDLIQTERMNINDPAYDQCSAYLTKLRADILQCTDLTEYSRLSKMIQSCCDEYCRNRAEFLRTVPTEGPRPYNEFDHTDEEGELAVD